MVGQKALMRVAWTVGWTAGRTGPWLVAYWGHMLVAEMVAWKVVRTVPSMVA